METSRLPALRPTSGGAEALVALVRKQTVTAIAHRNLQLAVEDPWDERDDYLSALAHMRETGEVRGLEAGLTAITVGTRSKSDIPLTDYAPGKFDELDKQDVQNATIRISSLYSGMGAIEVTFLPWQTDITYESGLWEVEGLIAPTMESIEEVLQAALEPWTSYQPTPTERPPFRVFIGHGGDSKWKDLRDDLRDHFGFEVEAFEAVPRTSQVISDVLQSMASVSTAAVLVLTKTDEMGDGSWRGRQNVVHEIGFFQGRLGWDRAIIVVEDGVTLPSNLDGTQQVRFPAGMIATAVGPVAAALGRLRDRPVGICM